MYFLKRKLNQERSESYTNFMSYLNDKYAFLTVFPYYLELNFKNLKNRFVKVSSKM